MQRAKKSKTVFISKSAELEQWLGQEQFQKSLEEKLQQLQSLLKNLSNNRSVEEIKKIVDELTFSLQRISDHLKQHPKFQISCERFFVLKAKYISNFKTGEENWTFLNKCIATVREFATFSSYCVESTQLHKLLFIAANQLIGAKKKHQAFQYCLQSLKVCKQKMNHSLNARQNQKTAQFIKIVQNKLQRLQGIQQMKRSSMIETFKRAQEQAEVAEAAEASETADGKLHKIYRERKAASIIKKKSVLKSDAMAQKKVYFRQVQLIQIKPEIEEEGRKLQEVQQERRQVRKLKKESKAKGNRMQTAICNITSFERINSQTDSLNEIKRPNANKKASFYLKKQQKGGEGLHIRINSAMKDCRGFQLSRQEREVSNPRNRTSKSKKKVKTYEVGKKNDSLKRLTQMCKEEDRQLLVGELNARQGQHSSQFQILERPEDKEEDRELNFVLQKSRIKTSRTENKQALQLPRQFKNSRRTVSRVQSQKLSSSWAQSGQETIVLQEGVRQLQKDLLVEISNSVRNNLSEPRISIYCSLRFIDRVRRGSLKSVYKFELVRNNSFLLIVKFHTCRSLFNEVRINVCDPAAQAEVQEFMNRRGAFKPRIEQLIKGSILRQQSESSRQGSLVLFDKAKKALLRLGLTRVGGTILVDLTQQACLQHRHGNLFGLKQKLQHCCSISNFSTFRVRRAVDMELVGELLKEKWVSFSKKQRILKAAMQSIRELKRQLIRLKQAVKDKDCEPRFRQMIQGLDQEYRLNKARQKQMKEALRKSELVECLMGALQTEPNSGKRPSRREEAGKYYYTGSQFVKIGRKHTVIFLEKESNRIKYIPTSLAVRAQLLQSQNRHVLRMKVESLLSGQARPKSESHVPVKEMLGDWLKFVLNYDSSWLQVKEVSQLYSVQEQLAFSHLLRNRTGQLRCFSFRLRGSSALAFLKLQFQRFQSKFSLQKLVVNFEQCAEMAQTLLCDNFSNLHVVKIHEVDKIVVKAPQRYFKFDFSKRTLAPGPSVLPQKVRVLFQKLVRVGRSFAIVTASTTLIPQKYAFKAYFTQHQSSYYKELFYGTEPRYEEVNISSLGEDLFLLLLGKEQSFVMQPLVLKTFFHDGQRNSPFSQIVVTLKTNRSSNRAYFRTGRFSLLDCFNSNLLILVQVEDGEAYLEEIRLEEAMLFYLSSTIFEKEVVLLINAKASQFLGQTLNLSRLFSCAGLMVSKLCKILNNRNPEFWLSILKEQIFNITSADIEEIRQTRAESKLDSSLHFVESSGSRKDELRPNQKLMQKAGLKLVYRVLYDTSHLLLVYWNQGKGKCTVGLHSLTTKRLTILSVEEDLVNRTFPFASHKIRLQPRLLGQVVFRRLKLVLPKLGTGPPWLEERAG